MASADLSGFALDALVPMHVLCGSTGHIRAAGPCFRKLCPEDPVGRRLLELLEIRRPRVVTTMAQLHDLAGRRLSLVLRDDPGLVLKGIAVALDEGAGMILNLSFGASLVSAVSRFGLTLSDFAPTDLAVETLYLLEAKSVAMAASRDLNARLQTARAQAEERSVTDALTGLGNRRALEHALGQVLRATERREFGLLHVDLDHFKAVNDTLGHAAGDLVLRHAATALNEAVRAGDFVARVGGDEFIIILRDCTDPGLMQAIGARIVDRLEEPVYFNGHPCRISASVGIVASTDYPDPDAERLLSDADAATYASKRAGRAQVTLHQA